MFYDQELKHSLQTEEGCNIFNWKWVVIDLTIEVWVVFSKYYQERNTQKKGGNFIFKMVPLSFNYLIPTSFLFVETPLKFLFWYGVMLRRPISFHFFNILKSFTLEKNFHFGNQVLYCAGEYGEYFSLKILSTFKNRCSKGSILALGLFSNYYRRVEITSKFLYCWSCSAVRLSFKFQNW